MPMARYRPEQIVTLLRQMEVDVANGKTIPSLPGSRDRPHCARVDTMPTHASDTALSLLSSALYSRWSTNSKNLERM
jgi:hypothetical protein